jgi:DNA-binding LytR/AlgR family response regulator
MINCIIIDDEPLARKGLKEYINEVDFLHLAGEFDNPFKAMIPLQEGNVQLLFLDIQMPRITGLEFLRSLPHPPPVILVTAYPQFALDGFDLNALDYLVKPVSLDRFLQAAFKAKEYYDLRLQNQAASKSPEGVQESFYIKSDNKLVRIRFDEILFIEALQNYVMVYTTHNKYITYLTFRSVEEYLPTHQFIRTHKSYLVAADRVESIEGNELLVAGHHIPVSRNEKEMVLEKLLKGKFLKR